MPAFGGNAGDPVDKSANTWASLTQLQYDRLFEWSQGRFVTGEPSIPPESFDGIDISKQPDALTAAALEWSVGAPMYPGIECYWVAEDEKHYILDTPGDRFQPRFKDTVKPGDLGKGLALPWQADFFMCNTHWWPSIRPDNIVTEKDWLSTKEEFREDPAKMANNLRRTPWDDGLARTDDDDDKLGNTEMTRKWMKLGFIAQEHYGPEMNSLPIFTEKERHPDFPRTT